MIQHKHLKTVASIFSIAMLMFHQGCASRSATPHLLPQPALAGERIGVVLKMNQAERALKIPGRGVASAMGRGAAVGAASGAYIGAGGLSGDSLAFLLIIPLSTIGAVGGAVYGAFASEAASKWDKAEAVFNASLAEIDTGRLFLERLITFANENGYPLRLLNGQSPNITPMDYRNLSQESIGLALELSEFTFELKTADSAVNPPRHFCTSVRAKIFRTNDGALLDDHIIIDDKGDVLPLDSWVLDNGLAFREQVSLAASRIAETIITELFLLDMLPERAAGTAAFGLITVSIMFGPEAIYPPLTEQVWWMASLQPTLRWEPLHENDVTYDLIIWRTTSNISGGERVEVYNRKGLLEAFHTLEIPLQSSTLYQWTVRARYKSAGKTRITGWAMWTTKVGRLAVWLTLGMAQMLPNPPPQYYSFHT